MLARISADMPSIVRLDAAPLAPGLQGLDQVIVSKLGSEPCIDDNLDRLGIRLIAVLYEQIHAQLRRHGNSSSVRRPTPSKHTHSPKRTGSGLPLRLDPFSQQQLAWHAASAQHATAARRKSSYRG